MNARDISRHLSYCHYSIFIYNHLVCVLFVYIYIIERGSKYIYLYKVTNNATKKFVFKKKMEQIQKQKKIKKNYLEI